MSTNDKTRNEFDVEITNTVGEPLLTDGQEIKMATRDCNVFYADNQAIYNVDLDIGKNEIIAMIDGEDIYGKDQDPVLLRARVGMVFQKANPFPKSIYDNVAYGARLHGLTNNKSDLDDLVEASLTKAGLFKEVKDNLHKPGTGLSGGQQQRLCIARTIAVDPEVILMDEPTSALDPIATAIIEELMDELRHNYTIAIVTHSMQQAARISQRTAYFHLGKLVEVNETNQVFTNPEHKLTENYITGRFG